MFAVYNTKIGKLKIEYDNDVLTGIAYAENEKEQGIRSELSDKTALQLEEYFDGKRKEFDISIKLIGTEFQKKVWNELLKIPYGETVSYKDIAMPYSGLRPYYRTIYLGKIAEDIRLYNIYSIATFIIPKGSEYYENGGGEIVSSNIIYTGKYVRIGNSEE